MPHRLLIHFHRLIQSQLCHLLLLLQPKSPRLVLRIRCLVVTSGRSSIVGKCGTRSVTLFWYILGLHVRLLYYVISG